MGSETVKRAQGYRVPGVEVKSMVLSIVTLGIKRPRRVDEAAKTYLYIFENEGIRINEVELNGNVKRIGFKLLESAAEVEKVLAKGKFKEGGYIYFLDKETIS